MFMFVELKHFNLLRLCFVGWFNASILREENGEKEAYELLTETYQQHEQSLLKQLLCAKGLPPSWGDILTPLIRDVICVIRPGIPTHVVNFNDFLFCEEI